MGQWPGMGLRRQRCRTRSARWIVGMMAVMVTRNRQFTHSVVAQRSEFAWVMRPKTVPTVQKWRTEAGPETPGVRRLTTKFEPLRKKLQLGKDEIVRLCMDAAVHHVTAAMKSTSDTAELITSNRRKKFAGFL